jgi:RES domain-containing protein
MRVYRLVKARFAEVAFDGSGAKTYGGRWNSPGVAMLYTSDSVALAALELLVHLHGSEILNRYLLCSLEIPARATMNLDDEALPADWRTDPAPSSTAAVGDEWITRTLSLALSVPSTLVPRQRNLLVNPLHPEFPELLSTATREAFEFDPRLGVG